jgi:hypothetical protein
MTYEGRLHHLLINNFSHDEFATLCLSLGVIYDHLRGDGFIARARDFIAVLQRRGTLQAFVDQALTLRPNVDWQERAGDPQLEDVSLQPPASGKGVLLDISHRQDEWPRSRPNTLFNRMQDLARGQGFDDGFVTEPAQLCDGGLATWQGLLMPMPWHCREMHDDVIEAIVRWVRAGGRMAVLGFELGPRHHESGINRLAERFGLRFNSDIAVPDDYARRLQKGVANWLEAGEALPYADWSAGNKPYKNAVDYDVDESAHPLLAGVQRVRWPSACTVTAEPGSRMLVSLGRNWLGQMMETSAQYDLAREALDTGSDRFFFIPNLPWWPVAAAAPRDLVNNRGQVIAIGTWDVLSYASSENHNERFVNNLLRWLAGE